MKIRHIAVLTACAALVGCAAPHAVISSTQTVVGVSVQENPATQLYEARLGYARNEFAFVPANTNCPASVPDVILELRVSNIFAGGMIYQRLAVGSTACAQPGASLMFAKDSSGQTGTNLIQVIQQLHLEKPH
jgi:hypothetical protein